MGPEKTATVRFEPKGHTYYVDCPECSPDRYLVMYQADGNARANTYARQHNAVMHGQR